jgi:hypothetical protein
MVPCIAPKTLYKSAGRLPLLAKPFKSDNHFTKPPTKGTTVSGYASCQRITIISENPVNKNRSAVMPYWIPITL